MIIIECLMKDGNRKRAYISSWSDMAKINTLLDNGTIIDYEVIK